MAIRYEKQWSDEFQEEVLTPIEINVFDDWEVDSKVEEALSGIKSAWKNMLTAEDKKTFDAWSKEQKRLEKILYQEKRKLYVHFRNTSEEYRASRRVSKDKRKSPGRPRKYANMSEKKLGQQQYQHEYYLRVTKAKRAQKKKME